MGSKAQLDRPCIVPILIASRTPGQAKGSRLRRRLIALGIGLMIVYGFLSFGHGTEQCERCGVEREAFCIGPAWFHTWTSEARRGPWKRVGSEICADHSWVHTGCWFMPNGIYCSSGPMPPTE